MTTEYQWPDSEQYLLDKKDVRIIFKTDKEFKEIIKFKVYECKNQYDINRLSTRELGTYKDYGNCRADWNEFPLSKLLLRLSCYDWYNYKMRKEIYSELGKIREWKEELAEFNECKWKDHE